MDSLSRLTAIAFLCFLSVFPARADSTAPKTIRSVADLCAAIRKKAVDVPFDLEGVVTLDFLREEPGSCLTLQDADAAGSLRYHPEDLAHPVKFGDRVRASGTIRIDDEKWFGRVCAFCTNLTVLAHGQAPRPLPATSAEFFGGVYSNRLIRIEGFATDAFADEIDKHYTLLTIDCDGETIYAAIRRTYKPRELQRFIGARIAAVGVDGGHNGRRLIIRKFLYLDSLDAVTILDNPRTIDPTEPADIRDKAFRRDATDKTPVRRFAVGHVLAAWDDNKVLIRTDSDELVRGELAEPPLPPFGSHIRLVGFPETDLYNIILFRARWKRESDACEDPLPAQHVRLGQIQSNEREMQRFDFIYHGQSVSLDGIVRGLPVKDGDGRLYLESDGQMVTIDVGATPSAEDGLDLGYRIRASGICVMETEKMGLNRVLPRVSGFRLVVRTPADIQVLSRPPWWSPTRLMAVIGVLLLTLAAVFGWNLALRRAAERRGRKLMSEQLARVESELKVGERTRLSVELHDSLSQNLLGASMEINTAEQLVTERDALQHLDIASKTLRASRDELRNCLWDLRSAALEDPDMNAAIRKTLEPHVSDIDLQVRFNVPRETFTDNTAHALMRIIRELVLNAIRHGHATVIKIAGSRENGQLLFSVRDNGCGFDPAAVPGIGQGHFGLQGVRERLRLLKGSVSIDSTPGAGTYVSARFRLPDGEKEKI